ncbi:putative F-box protein At1g67623 [Lotus japonicus]|uniref:putative F-box protein At1g67623 n=1 Tax=Lotus japonicus TaxID=34305 RepID=UPI00258B3910|nr:putative F-box protein At1g67623 [Lotus japonicus]
MVRTTGGRSADGLATRVPSSGLATRVPSSASSRRLRTRAQVYQPPPYQTNSRLVKKTRSKRQHTRKGSYSSTTIQELPRDLLVEVVATVASNSFIDFNTIKICCRDFLDATEDNYVWHRVSLDNFPLIQWRPNDKVSSFLARCRECGNMESLYREGLQKYFGYPDGKMDGLEILKATAQKGHKEAKYVCGVILLCSDDDKMRKQGLDYMRILRKFKCVIESRNKVKKLLNFLWKRNGMNGQNQSPLCNSKSTCKGWRVKNGLWELLDDDDDDYDISLCEYCRWDHELKFFYK